MHQRSKAVKGSFELLPALDKKNYKESKMSHHGDSKYVTGDFSPDDQQIQLEKHKEKKQLLKSLERHHSDATKAMFSEFTLMYSEIKSLGINPVQLYEAWRMR